MNKDWLASATLSAVPAICTVVFLLAFIVMLVCMFLPGSAASARKFAKLPFEGKD